MPSVIIYDNESTPAQVRRFVISVNPSEYAGRNDVLVFDDRTIPSESEIKSFLLGKDLKYVKVVNKNVVDYTPEEKSDQDAADVLVKTAELRTLAAMVMDSPESFGKLIRGIVSVLLDEINVLRMRERDRASDIANATSLADLKVRWAARSAMDDRTMAQAKIAVKLKIESGEYD